MTERSIDQAVKHAESRQLLRSAVPLIAAGAGVASLYASFAMTSDLAIFWIGLCVSLLGSALAAVGNLRRFGEIRSPRPSTGRHYAWLFAGWACAVAGLLISPYVLA